MSNDANNRVAGVVAVVPLSSKINKVYPFEVLLPATRTGLLKDSKASAQQIRTISRLRLAEARAGLVAPELMRALDVAIRMHLGLA